MSEGRTHWDGCWEADTHGECARVHARAAVNRIHELERERDALRGENDRLRKDAERYQHWRNLSGPVPACFLRLVGDELDTAIDAALAAKEPT